MDVRFWHKAEIAELNTAPLGFSAVVDRQFQEGTHYVISYSRIGDVRQPFCTRDRDKCAKRAANYFQFKRQGGTRYDAAGAGRSAC